MADKVEGDRGVPEAKVEDVVVPEVKDEFSEAFEEAGKVGEKADLSAADDPKNIKEEEPVVPLVVPSAEEKHPEKTLEKPPETPPIPSSEQQPGESDEKYEQRYKTLQGIHKHDRETWETEKAKLLSEIEEAKKPKTPEVPPKKEAVETFIESLTDEQKKQLEDYEKDFDVVSQMEGIKRKVELGNLKKEMMDTIQTWKDEFVTKLTETETNLTSKIAPAVKLAEDSDQEAHFSLIRNGYLREDGTEVPGHEDFEKFRDDGSLMTWIESKPKYLQPALKETYSKGAATDVIDLISDFKRESNLTTQPPSNVVTIDPKKAARKQTLTTVTTRRGAVNTGFSVPDDFEGAFDEAVHK